MLLSGSKNGIARFFLFSFKNNFSFLCSCFSVFAIDSKENKPYLFQQNVLNMKSEISSVNWLQTTAGIASYYFTF